MDLEGFSYKLEVGSKSSESDDIYMSDASYTKGRNRIDELTFSLDNTADARAVVEGNTVRLETKETGGANWLNRFIGEVMEIRIKSGSGLIQMRALGLAKRFKERKIVNAHYGGTLIDDKEYALTIDGSGNYYVALDNDATPQSPLIRLRYLTLKESLHNVSGISLTNHEIYDHNVDGEKTQAQMFCTRLDTVDTEAGFLRKIWMRIKKQNNCDKDLRVDIQGDSAGAPDGNSLGHIDIANADIGTSYTWEELDFRSKLIVLDDKEIYWIVLTMQAQTAVGAAYKYHVQGSGYSHTATILGTRYSRYHIGGAWIANVQALRYCIDMEGYWRDLTDGIHYKVVAAHKYAFLYKVSYDVMESGTSRWFGVRPARLDSTQKIFRASYWKGSITYDTMIDNMLEDWLSDVYDTLTVTVTEPDIPMKGYIVKGVSVWDFLVKIREKVPIAWRIYEDASNNIIVEVVDEMVITDWGGQAAGWKTARTFKHGQDTATDAYMKIIDDTLEKVIQEQTQEIIIVGCGGKNLGWCSDTGATGPALKGAVLIDDTDTTDGPAKVVENVDKYLKSVSTVRTSGDIILSHVDMDTSTDVFTDPNELVSITDSQTGFSGQYAVEEISVTFGTGGWITSLTLDDSVTTYTRCRPYKSRSSGIVDLVAGKVGFGPSEGRETVKRTISDGGTWGAEKMDVEGVFNCPILYDCSTDILYNAALFYWVSVGDGVPGGGALGNELSTVRLAPTDSPNEGFTTLSSEINKWDFPGDQGWPVDVKELAVKTSAVIDGAKTTLQTYTIGSPTGSYDIVQKQPLLTRDGKLTVILKITPEPPS